MQWGERHLVADGPVRLFAHAACGTDLAHDGTCPSCGIEPAAGRTSRPARPGLPSVIRRDAISRALREPAPAAHAGGGVIDSG